MQIIWHPDAAERLSNSHTVLELESFPVNGEILRAWCVVPAEKIGLSSLANLPALKDLHNKLVTAWKEHDYDQCENLIPHLMGKFGGELDSFYEELTTRITNKRNESANS
jgi:hypothetical protein